MNIIFKTSLFFAAGAIITWAISLLMGFTVLVKMSDVKYNNKYVKFAKGDTVNFLKDIDTHKGNWKVYLLLNKSELGKASKLFSKSNCYETTDIRLIEDMQKKWNFLYSDSDVSTIQSQIYFVKDGKIVFEGAIALDDNEGIQNSTYGWITPVKKGALKNSCKKFKRVYSPFILL